MDTVRKNSDNARTLLARALLDANASKLEVMELVVRNVRRAFPELSSEEVSAVSWRFLKDLTVAAQEVSR